MPPCPRAGQRAASGLPPGRHERRAGVPGAVSRRLVVDRNGLGRRAFRGDSDRGHVLADGDAAAAVAGQPELQPWSAGRAAVVRRVPVCPAADVHRFRNACRVPGAAAVPGGRRPGQPHDRGHRHGHRVDQPVDDRAAECRRLPQQCHAVVRVCRWLCGGWRAGDGGVRPGVPVQPAKAHGPAVPPDPRGCA
ncbi:hypothetical protein D3C75_967180 [compost metagenome]